MSADAVVRRFTTALAARGYLHTRQNPETGEREFQFDYEKCIVAAARAGLDVPTFLANQIEEYWADEEATR